MKSCYYLINKYILAQKEHMLNCTKRITRVVDFIITCPYDHLRGHAISIA